ncbi:MAG TPA: FAD-dependent oxidoreductase [Chitinophagaceae bacterium]|nr:FAD-dependent oxidoreductase [Chitinophagaceae bacterium]
MKTEFIIVGQGITGTWLSYYLQKEKKSFLVIDNNKHNSASRVAAGIINPVTGRRIVKTWMIEQLLEHLIPAYKELGKELNIKAISQKNVIDFHPTPQMKLAFRNRLKENEIFLKEPDDENIFNEYFYYDFGFGEVNPCYIINLHELLPAWRNILIQNIQLLEENFEFSELKQTEENIRYKDIEAEKIIFCDGINSFSHPLFKNLPFSLNKGEALIIESAEIPSTHIFKKGIMLAPLENNFFWVGSNYLWDFSDDHPTKEFRLQTESILKKWIRMPFKIIDHQAAIRPANIERRPFAGFHPLNNRVGILNGMGTKGCSLAPFFAKQLVDNIIYNNFIDPEADLKRFSKILAR